MQVMHYPVGTLCRPGAVELFVGTTYWVAYQDPVIAARVRMALASRFTVDAFLNYRVGSERENCINQLAQEIRDGKL